MSSKKKLIIIVILGALVISSLAFLIFMVIGNKQEVKNNIIVITSSYDDLSNSVKEYNDIRSKYITMSSDFILSKYKDSHEEYITLLNNYNAVMKEIDESVEKINNKCNRLYKDENVNTICANYEKIYEKLVNLYVTDLNDYNEKINKYNEYSKEEISSFRLMHSDYLDYNHDGIYEGRDNLEEN